MFCLYVYVDSTHTWSLSNFDWLESKLTTIMIGATTEYIYFCADNYLINIFFIEKEKTSSQVVKNDFL